MPIGKARYLHRCPEQHLNVLPAPQKFQVPTCPLGPFGHRGSRITPSQYSNSDLKSPVFAPMSRTTSERFASAAKISSANLSAGTLRTPRFQNNSFAIQQCRSEKPGICTDVQNNI